MDGRITNVALIGAGTMGRQIAAQAAVFGMPVRLYDANKDVLEQAKAAVKSQIESYYLFGIAKGIRPSRLHGCPSSPTFWKAVEGADLVLEAVPENMNLKKKVFTELDRIAPAHAIIATNSSSIPVSKIEDAVKRKEKVINIHFYLPIARLNMVDLMRGTQTSDETFEKAKAWVEDIGCIPLCVARQCMGFVFNRIWRAVKRDALAAWSGRHCDFRDIDRGWMLMTGMPMGPFGMMDLVGLDVVYDIEMSYYEDSKDPKDRPPDELKAMIGRGEIGMKAGKGFYDWKKPEFSSPDFIKAKNTC